MGDAKYKLKHKEAGLCVDCSNPAIPGKLLCLKHYNNKIFTDKRYYNNNREHKIVKSKLLKKRYREEGRCPMCSAPLGEQDKGFANCMNCRLRQYWPKGNYAYHTKDSPGEL